MSNKSFGMVFTPSWMEVWKIGKDNEDGVDHSERFRIIGSGSLEDRIKEIFEKMGIFSEGNMKMDVSGVYLPDRLKKALVCGITRDGSLKAAEKLARSLLFSPEVFYIQGDVNSSFMNEDCDAVIIGGGFDDSKDDKIRKLIVDIGESDWFKKNKPAVIYAGNKESVSTAQLKFSPFSDFFEMTNVLEEKTEDIDHNSIQELDTINQFSFDENNGISNSLKLNTYQESLSQFAQFMCNEASGRVVSVMINEGYSILNQCRLESGKPVIENRALPRKAEDLNPEDFSNFYKEFSLDDISAEKDIFSIEDILQIGRKKSDTFFRPDRIVGISVSENATVKKFLDLISDPDIVRGVVEYDFDSTGFFLMCGSVLCNESEKVRETTEKLIDEHEFESGWLVIPDGKYMKDEIALEVYIGGESNEKTSQLFWGKRYTIPVKKDSVIELRLKGTAFLAGRSSLVVLKTGKRQKDLVVDIRKEKS